MVFRAPKEKIERCIAIASSIISSKPQMNILANILLETEDNRIQVTSTDLEVGIRTSFEAEIKTAGSITVNGAKLLGIIRQLPAEEIVFEVDANNDIRIKSGNSSLKAKFTLKGIPKENYPPVPEEPTNGRYYQAPQAALKEMIRKTIFSISFENSRQYLNGVLFEAEKKVLRLVSTDGRRLAFIEREFDFQGESGLNSIVPHKVLSEVVKHLGDEGNISFSFTDNQVFFRFDDIHLVSTLIDGNFPNYLQVIPKKQEKFALINRRLFGDSLSRSSLLVEEKTNQVKLDFSDNHLVISINNTDVGSFREELGIEYRGEPIEVAFNHKYLKEYLKEVPDEDVQVEMNTPLSPVTLRSHADERYLYIVMPMKVT